MCVVHNGTVRRPIRCIRSGHREVTSSSYVAQSWRRRWKRTVTGSSSERAAHDNGSSAYAYGNVHIHIITRHGEKTTNASYEQSFVLTRQRHGRPALCVVDDLLSISEDPTRKSTHHRPPVRLLSPRHRPRFPRARFPQTLHPPPTAEHVTGT